MKTAIVNLATIVSGDWNGIALGSPLVWAVAYALLGRREKSAVLFEHGRRDGASPRALARLLAEPLPEEIASALRPSR